MFCSFAVAKLHNCTILHIFATSYNENTLLWITSTLHLFIGTRACNCIVAQLHNRKILQSGKCVTV